MANVKLLFYGTAESGFHDTSVECYVSNSNHLVLSIDEGSCPANLIALDRETAIQLVKEMKKQISYLES